MIRSVTDAGHARSAPASEVPPSFASHVMRRYTIVAVEIRDDLVNEHVALDLTEDRRSMSSKRRGNDPNTQASHPPARDLTSFIQIDVGVSED